MSEITVAIGSAAEVLSYLFPSYSKSIAESEKRLVQAIERFDNSSVSPGSGFGHAIGKEIVEYAKNDGSDLPFANFLETINKCTWNGLNWLNDDNNNLLS